VPQHGAMPERSVIERSLRDQDVEEWLALWWVSQGGDVRNRRFDLISAILPFDRAQPIDVLDMCCGPGDLGRSIQRRFGRARLDCVDRDRFLLALGAELNRRRGIATRVFECDGWDPDWRLGLDRKYHVVAAATALHWFDVPRLGELFREFHGLLQSAGVLVFAEPAAPESEFSAGHAEWAEKDEAAYDLEGTWAEFWSRANRLLGYDHRAVLEKQPTERCAIGDHGIPVLRYVELLRAAGFERIDVLRRESSCVTIAAIKS
jgi:trans-aconitate methyltransferase